MERAAKADAENRQRFQHDTSGWSATLCCRSTPKLTRIVSPGRRAAYSLPSQERIFARIFMHGTTESRGSRDNANVTVVG
jgi:hypothetical protein